MEIDEALRLNDGPDTDTNEGGTRRRSEGLLDKELDLTRSIWARSNDEQAGPEATFLLGSDATTPTSHPGSD